MVIEIKNLSKSYGETVVLDNVNLTLDSAKPICIMGQSGRGKTTLFNILLGLLKADSGEIKGSENSKFSAVFQEDRLCEQLSAIMNIAIVLDNPDKKQLTDKLLKMGLTEDEIHRPVSQLSGGQKRRVAILRALVSDSDAVLMDEPFKGLDEDTRKIVIQQVKQNLGTRLLMVITHNEEDAAALGATVINL